MGAVAREVVEGAPQDGPRVALDHEARALRRRRLVTEAGEAFLVDLPATVRLVAGQGLRLEDGRVVAVAAAPEPLWEVRGDLARLAWHVGNRHAACEVRGDHLRVRRETVMGRMLEGLGAALAAVEEPFEPEGGAYAGHDHAGLGSLGGG